MANKKLFICDIADFSRQDEGATKLTIALLSHTPGEKIVLNIAPDRVTPPPELPIKLITLPFPARPIYHPLFVLDYLRFILATVVNIIKIKPDEVYFILFKHPRPLGQLHALMLSMLSKDFKQILYQKPKINFWFKAFTRFRIGVISKETESWLKSKGVDAFYYPIGHQKPDRSYNKKELRKKYGFNEDDFIILHVGHAVVSRGMDVLSALAERISDRNDRILVVLSSWHEKNKRAIKKLLGHQKIVVIDQYIEDIYEIYAMADVYVFPIKQPTNAIDIPLSVLEAKELNLPIVASDIDNIRNLTSEYGGENISLIKVSTSEMMAREIQEAISQIKRDTAHEER